MLGSRFSRCCVPPETVFGRNSYFRDFISIESTIKLNVTFNMSVNDQTVHNSFLEFNGNYLFTILLVFFASIFYFAAQNKKSVDKDVKDKNHSQPVVSQKTQNKKKKGLSSSKENRKPFTHHLLKKTLKGHGNKILDMDVSSNGKLLATCSEDRSIMIWSLKDISSKDQRNTRGNVDFDFGSSVRWSPDNKAFLIQRACDATMDIFKITKKADGFYNKPEVTTTFPKEHDGSMVGMDIASSGKYIMSCSNKNDMIIWSLKGEVLHKVNTCQGETWCAKVSPCGRFVASSGFTPDVKVWEVSFSKSDDFEKVERAFELKGHTSGIPCFAFSADSSSMLSVSKDKSWRLYNIQVEYKKQQDPIIVRHGSLDIHPSDHLLCALSSDAQALAIVRNKTLIILSAVDGNELETIEEPHSDVDPENIGAVIFDPFNKYIFTTGDKMVRIFKNIPGHEATIKYLENKLQHASSQMKKRISLQIEEVKDNLNGLITS